MKRALLITLFAVLIGSLTAQAQGSGTFAGVTQCWINGTLTPVKGSTCPSTGNSGGSSSAVNSAAYSGLNQASYQLGYALGQWLFGSGTNPQAELQKRLMMEELRRRQAEAERQHREMEARRLAEMYNRLASTLKLSGLPNLQLKETASSGQGLKLKLGDNPDGQAGIKGLPGIYLNDGKVPYGIPGLPGMYTGGPGQGSGLTNSKLTLKTGEGGATGAQSGNGVSALTSSNASGGPSAEATNGSGAALTTESGLRLKTGDNSAMSPAQSTSLDPSKMTPQQLADVAEMVSKLPPEEQQRLMNAAQNNSGQPLPGMVGQPNTQALAQQQASASQDAAGAPVLEDASAKARAGFDTPLSPGATQTMAVPISGQPPVAAAPASAATPIPRTAPPTPIVQANISQPPRPNAVVAQPGPEAERTSIIKNIDALAEKLGWSAEKQARLDMALNKLDFDGDPDVTRAQIGRTWQDVIARGQDPALARESSRGGGLGFPGAGTQTVNHDCAVFAVANAAGVPYGVVATRATELIRLGNWRDDADRANPQATIERRGLTGGEVVMLAESFGQAEIVSSADFAKTLAAGRPVLINVIPPGAIPHSGHEVVLTRTFQHGGETWFEMMDSTQGPQRRLFLSNKELNTILQENGVAFRSEPGLTPKLLQDGGNQ